MFESLWETIYDLFEQIVLFGEDAVYLFGTPLDTLISETTGVIPTLLGVVVDALGAGNMTLVQAMLTLGLTVWVVFAVGRFFLPFI